MAARVTEAEVIEVKPTTASSAAIVASITAASQVVDRLAASACGGSLTAEELKEVERWLAAHFLSVVDPVLIEEKFENASSRWQRGSQGSGLLSTQYGQMANTLSGGCLAELDKIPASVVFA